MGGDHRQTDDPEYPTILAPTSPADALNFGLGIMDAVLVVVASLVGRGLIEPDSFQADMRKRAELHLRHENPCRAAAAEFLEERLKGIEAAKRMANARMVVPENRSVN